MYGKGAMTIYSRQSSCCAQLGPNDRTRDSGSWLAVRYGFVGVQAFHGLEGFYRFGKIDEFSSVCCLDCGVYRRW